jgi:hypothetical protein
MVRRREVCTILMGLLLAAGSFCVAASSGAPQSCTVFAGTDGDAVWVGNNEDYGNPVINVWFLPASDARYGRFLIGTEGIVQGGVNERGLAYDSLTIPPVEVAADERPLHLGMWPLHALETCGTVEEVVSFYEEHSFPGTWDGKAFFADATGDAVVFEGSAVVRKSERFFVSTNFLQSVIAPAEITCDRFLTATSMLETAGTYSEELFREILDAVHAEYHGGAGTIYSTIYDLNALTITCYLYHDYEQSVVFDLRERLALGEQVFELRSAFPPNAAYESWRAGEIETLARRIASFRDEGADPAAFADVAGHYVVSGEDPYLYPPLAIDSFSVESVNDRLSLVVCPEGLSFELFPLRSDRFRSAGMNRAPDFDVEFHRDTSGDVVGATFLASAAGVEVELGKVSDVPLFHPLPDFMVPFPEPEEAALEPTPHVSPAFWLGVGLAALGLLGLAIVLLLP